MIQTSKHQQINMRKTLFIILIHCLILVHVNSLGPWFCHSDCISSTGACFQTTSDSCYVCANSVFKDKDFTNPHNPCVPKDQRQIFFRDLQSSAPLSLTGFTTSNPTTFNCSTMSFAGKYVNTDYLQKNFTGITKQHYELVIRFNVAYIGTWSTTDTLKLQINDGVSTSTQTWGYTCGPAGSDFDQYRNLCSIQGTDCVKAKEFVIQHNASYVTLKWSSLTSQSDPNVQSWGIKDILIAGKTCHRYCDKCFGESVNECLTCSAGYFLIGNKCVSQCPRLSITATQQCVESCPNKYFHNTLNDICEPCLEGCSLCSGQSNCLLWDNQTVDTKSSLFYDKMQLWIVLIILGFGILGLVIWKFVIRRYFWKSRQVHDSSGSESPKSEKEKSAKSSNSGELNNMRLTSDNLTNQLWMVDAESLDPVKVDVRRRKKRKADINETFNNSEVHIEQFA